MPPLHLHVGVDQSSPVHAIRRVLGGGAVRVHRGPGLARHMDEGWALGHAWLTVTTASEGLARLQGALDEERGAWWRLDFETAARPQRTQETRFKLSLSGQGRRGDAQLTQQLRIVGNSYRTPTRVDFLVSARPRQLPGHESNVVDLTSYGEGDSLVVREFNSLLLLVEH